MLRLNDNRLYDTPVNLQSCNWCVSNFFVAKTVEFTTFYGLLACHELAKNPLSQLL